MTMLLAALLVLQLLVPLGQLAWLAFGRTRSRAMWVVRIALVGAYLAAVALAGLWLWWQGRLYETRWFQKLCMAMTPSGSIRTPTIVLPSRWSGPV